MKRRTSSQNGHAPLEVRFNVEILTGEYDMGSHSVEITQKVKGIEAWMDALGINIDAEERPRETVTTGPSTPPQKLRRQRYEGQLCDEVSPTDTNFSSDPVFDSPFSPNDWSCISSHNRHQYPITEASSLDDEDEARARKELLGASVQQSDHKGLKSADQVPKISSPDSTILSKIPSLGSTSSDLSPDLATVATLATSNFDPHAAHLIWLTSCLQCVLSGLPCSRTLPACSRCIRRGNGEHCLLQRKRLHVEIFADDDSVDTDPILLERVGDSKDVSRQKVQLQYELIKAWREREERKNWIIPVNDGIRGDWKTTVLREATVHPGEGTGRPTYHRMQVAQWHDNAMRKKIRG